MQSLVATICQLLMNRFVATSQLEQSCASGKRNNMQGFAASVHLCWTVCDMMLQQQQQQAANLRVKLTWTQN